MPRLEKNAFENTNVDALFHREYSRDPKKQSTTFDSPHPCLERRGTPLGRKSLYFVHGWPVVREPSVNWDRAVPRQR